MFSKTKNCHDIMFLTPLHDKRTDDRALCIPQSHIYKSPLWQALFIAMSQSTTEAGEAKHSFCSSGHVGMPTFHLQKAAPAPTPICTQKTRRASSMFKQLATQHLAFIVVPNSRQSTRLTIFNQFLLPMSENPSCNKISKISNRRTMGHEEQLRGSGLESCVMI